ncbi:MAG: Glutamate synthase [NADPH] small chain, partial [uncultured Solirubrobacteraceae bacterium]
GRARSVSEDRAPRGPLPRPPRAAERLRGVRRRAAAGGARRAGRALHGVRRSVLPQRLPGREPHPRLERPRLPRPLPRRDQAAARHEQLPGVHRPPVSGAVRGRLRAGDPRGGRGHDQADRERDHQPRLGGGLGAARAARGERTDGPHGRRGRRRARGPGRRAAAAPRGSRGDPLRARRGRGRAHPLRRPRLQDREARRRTPGGAARRRRRGAALRRRRRFGRHRRGAPRAVRGGGARHGFARPARPAGPRPGAHGHPPGAGVPLRAQPGGRRRRSLPRTHHRGRQARGGHRRRGHRRRLRRQLAARGRRLGHPARAAARTAEAAARRQDPVAVVAAEVPPLLRAGGGPCRAQGRRGVLRGHHPLRRDRGRRRARARRRRRRARPAVRPRRGLRTRAAGRSRAAGDGLPAPGARAGRRLGPREGSAREHQGRHLRDLGARRLRRGRLPPGPEPHRLGDQRGPPGRPHGRSPSARDHSGGGALARALRERLARRRGPRGSAAARVRRHARRRRL